MLHGAPYYDGPRLMSDAPKHSLLIKSRNQLAASLHSKGQFTEALSVVEQTLNSEADLSYELRAEALNIAAACSLRLHRPADAEAGWRQCIDANPDFAEAYDSLGTLLKSLSRLSEAEAIYRRLQTLRPDLAESHNNLGAVLYDLRRLPEAESSYRQAIATRTPILKDGTPDYRFSSHTIDETPVEPGDASFVGRIYDDKDFVNRLKIQRAADHATSPSPLWAAQPAAIPTLVAMHAMIPPLQLSFTAKNETTDMQYRSNAPPDLILEDYGQRMNWIKDTAKSFHSLIQKKTGLYVGRTESDRVVGRPHLRQAPGMKPKLTNWLWFILTMSACLLLSICITKSHEKDKAMSPGTVTVKLGMEGNAGAEAQNFDTMNHPSGLYFFKKHWDDRNKSGTVLYMQGPHSFEIDNVSIVRGTGDKDRPKEGVTNWDILFGVNSEPTASYQEALNSTMALLARLRAAGWKRYISTADPRLSGREATLYALSESGSIYSMDSSYKPTMEEWKKIVTSEPQWYFYADGVYLNVTISYQPTDVDKGYYLMDVDIQAASDFYLPYFSDSPQKMKEWEKYLPGEVGPEKKYRLAKEARLKTQGYTIDTTYQAPPIEASEFSSGMPH